MEPMLRTSFGISIDRTTGCAIESGGGRFSSGESELRLSMHTKCTTVCTRWRRRNEQRHGDEVEQRGGMPKKWTHLEFMVELVYDLIYPTQTATHLSTIGELDDRSIDSTKSLSSFASVDESQLEEEVNLDCSTGRETTWKKEHPPR